MKDRQTTPLSAQAPSLERAPDSGRIQLLSNRAPQQPVEDRVADVRAKMERGEALCDADKDLLDQMAANLIGKLQSVASAGKSDPSTYLRMLKIAEAAGISTDSIAPGASEEPPQSVIVPPNSNPTGITGREDTVFGMAAITQTSGTPAAMATAAPVVETPIEAPQSAVNSSVNAVMAPVTVAPEVVVTPPISVSPSGRISPMPVPTEVLEAAELAMEQKRLAADQSLAAKAQAEAEAQLAKEELAPITPVAPIAVPESVKPKVSSNPPGRIIYPHAQLIVTEEPQQILQAQTVADDFDNDPEMYQFINSTRDPEYLAKVDEKRLLKGMLDDMALMNQNEAARREYTEAKKSTSVVKNVATLLFVDAPLALPRFLERAFVGAKLEIFKNLKVQKEHDLREARRNFENDLAEINTGVDATSEYLDRSYGKTFRLGAMSEQEVSSFFNDCMYNVGTKPQHHQNVCHIMEQQARERLAAYNAEILKIKEDQSYEENVHAMLYGTPAAADEPATKGSLYLRARNWVGGLFQGNKEEKESAARRSWIDKKVSLPALDMVVSYGRHQQALIHDVNNVPETVESTSLTDMTKLKKEQEKKRRNKRLGVLAGAAAGLAIGLLGAIGIIKYAKNRGAEDSTEKGATAMPSTAPTSAPVAANSNAVAANNSVVQNPVPIVTPVESPNLEPKVAKTAPAAVAKPQKAKTVIVPKSKGKPSVLEPKVVPKEIADNVQLNQQEKDQALRSADSKISAYKRQVATILGKDFQPNPTDAETLYALLDQVTGTLKTLHTHGELKALNGTFDRIDGTFAKLTKERTAKFAPIFVAKAEQDSQNALNKLATVRTLMGGRTKFTINHPVNKSAHAQGETETRMPYNVDLDAIGLKLAKIKDETSAGKSQNLSETQARLDAADAKYWLGYLDFVDWYARYKVNDKVSVTY